MYKLFLILITVMVFFIIINTYKLYENFSEYNKIPKIIHQTWKSKELPDNFKKWSKIIKDLHPDWKYKLWTDEDNRNFIKNNYPWFLKTYDSYDINIKRIDAVRYFLLHHFGGVYIDLDFICLKKLDPLIKNNNAVFGYQLKDKSSIANAFMISPSKHNLFKQIINNLESKKDKHVLKATGPAFLTENINIYLKKLKNNSNKIDIDVLPMPLIYTRESNKIPCDINECKKIYPDSYTTTFWTGSWLKKEQKEKKKKFNKYIL